MTSISKHWLQKTAAMFCVARVWCVASEWRSWHNCQKGKHLVGNNKDHFNDKFRASLTQWGSRRRTPYPLSIDQELKRWKWNVHRHTHMHALARSLHKWCQANNRAGLNVPLTGYHIRSPLSAWLDFRERIAYCPSAWCLVACVFSRLDLRTPPAFCTPC